MAHWLWLTLFALLAILWLWILLRQRLQQPSRSSVLEETLERAEAEDLLKAAYFRQQTHAHLRVDDLARSLHLPASLVRRALDALRAFGWIEQLPDEEIRLTSDGEARARDLIRAHRLWESYLVDREGIALDAVHDEAHLREHSTTAEELERLDAELGHPAWDPHGHPIPGPGSRVPALSGRPLSEEAGRRGRLRIVSLEEEPTALLAQLVVLGLKPGVDVTVVDRKPDVLRLQVGDQARGAVVPLASAAAHHLHVVPVPALPVQLGELPAGSRAQVVEVEGAGKHQRRMLDMGFVPGARVDVMRRAPLGDPIQYRVKGTAVALRQREANTILVEEVASG